MATGTPSSYEFAPEEVRFVRGEDSNQPTVLAWRPAEDWSNVREMVARRQIDELIRNDPERVSTILSRWAADEERAART